MGRVELSFVVPAYDEEAFVEVVLWALDKVVKNKMLPYEIVVVDDGSKDATLAKAKRYTKRKSHVKVVNYFKNMGKGYSVKTGFIEATGDVVVFADSDMEIDSKR